MTNITVSISDETLDSLFKDILVQDYRHLCKDIQDAEARFEKLKPYEKEDLDYHRRWRDAIAIAMEYYIEHHTRLEVLGIEDE